MSKLLELIDKVKSIPAKERHADRVGSLTKLCEAVERGTADLTALTAAARNSEAVIGRNEFTTVSAAATAVARQASRLRQSLERTPEAAWSHAGDDLMITINERVGVARKALRERWRAFVEVTKRDYGVLERAGREAQLGGAAGLESALLAFDSVANIPPPTTGAAQKVREHLEALRIAVRDLGLAGEVGDFMVAAAEGRADPRDLYKPSVKEFLDGRPEVWRLLTVKLQARSSR